MARKIAAVLLFMCLSATTAIAAPTAQLNGGKTTVWLSPDFVGALVGLGVSPSSIDPGSLNLRRGYVRYPIVGGVIDLDSLAGDIFHRGGLRLEANDTTVSLYNFVISTLGDTPVLTGVAAVNGDVVARIPLFDLELTREPRVTRWGGLRVWGVEVTLTDTAASTLNQVFGVENFAGGLQIGKAYLKTRVTGVEGDDDYEDDDYDD